jgi:hypothetical protein
MNDQSRLPSSGWVRLSKYCLEKGETRDGVSKRVRSGHWLKGVHLRRPDGSKELWVNLDAVNDWAAGRKPTHLHGNGAK